MSQSNPANGQYSVHWVVFVVAVIAIGAYEGLKQWLFGDLLSPWQSHAMTILVGALASVAASLFMQRRMEHYENSIVAIEREASLFRKTLMNALPVAVFYKDREGRYLGCNHVFADIMGVSEAEISGKTVYELWPSELARTYHDKDLELMAQPQVQEYEFQVKAKSGALLDVIYRKSVFFDADDRVAGIIGAFVDISEKKAAEEKLNEYSQHLEALVREKTAALEGRNRELVVARDAAEAANRAKSEFLDTMSHELRTPLNQINGITELALMREDSAMTRDDVQRVLEASRTMLGLVTDLLAFSNFEKGLAEVDPVAFPLAEVLNGLVSALKAKARRRQIRFTVEVEPRIPAILLGDPDYLSKVLLHLGDNAVKFTPAGGEIEVRVSGRGEDEEGVLLHFSVRDSGIGIGPEQRDRLFQPFTQADGSNARKYGGTGLGLALCSALVEMMHGEIWLESEQGVGSTFHFTARFGKQDQQRIVWEHREEPASMAQASGDKPLDVAAVRSGLQQLRSHLAESNIDALSLIENLPPFFAGTKYAEQMGALVECVRGYDFTRGLTLLEALMEEIGLSD